MKPAVLLALAEQAARKAGEVLSHRDPSLPAVEAEKGHDIKLAADRISEKIILETLSQESDWAVYSEESGLRPGKRESPFRWVVDPLDGSANYSRGVPFCCVSVALWKGKNPILGVIYDFNRRELFAGVVGAGARLNGVPIRVSSVKENKKGVIGTGFPIRFNYSSESVAEFAGTVRTYKKIRMMGSAALSMAYVAAGRTDVYYEKNIELWDVAAGAAIVRAAGGRVLVKYPRGCSACQVYADNGKLKPPKKI